MSNYETLYDLACGMHGLVTTAEAHEAGVSDKELSRLTSAGKLSRLSRGVYRIDHHMPSRVDQFAIAVASAGASARLYGESVLAFFNLCATDPRHVHVGVARRVRRQLPPYVQLHRVPADEEIANYDGILSQPVAVAIIAARPFVLNKRLQEAADEARRKGLMFDTEYYDIKGRLDHDVRH